MGSWDNMGYAGNKIIKANVHPFINSVYFGDGDEVNSNPAKVIIMHQSFNHKNIGAL